jgi:hypothetical protein
MSTQRTQAVKRRKDDRNGHGQPRTGSRPGTSKSPGQAKHGRPGQPPTEQKARTKSWTCTNGSAPHFVEEPQVVYGAAVDGQRKVRFCPHCNCRTSQRATVR